MSVVWNKAFALKFIFTHCYFFSKITFLRNNSNTQTEISTTVGAIVPHEKIFGYNWRFFWTLEWKYRIISEFFWKMAADVFQDIFKKFYLKLFRQILFLKKYFFKSYYRFTSKDLTWNWKFYVAPLAKSCSSSNNVKKGT